MATTYSDSVEFPMVTMCPAKNAAPDQKPSKANRTIAAFSGIISLLILNDTKLKLITYVERPSIRSLLFGLTHEVIVGNEYGKFAIETSGVRF